MVERAAGAMSPAGSDRLSKPPARPESWRGAEAGRLLLIVAQFALLTMVFYQYELESVAVRRVLLVAFAGFVMQLAVPLAFRRWWFVVLSVVALTAVFGVTGALWVLGTGSAVIGICHLPVAFAARVALLLGGGATLALFRAEVLTAPWPPALWAVLGSILMFRTILYMYELRGQPNVAADQAFAYFFLLPNVCFPLFPVVDFRSFVDTYHARPALTIYQQGLHWMTRGLLHLILFRVVYYHFVLGPAEVENLGQLIQFLVTNILLYLRVSGQFHLIVGLLKMFGFDLLETNHLYFLASGLTDFWRRINIYWKDFMLKVFYLPLFFRLRRAGMGVAVVVSSLFVFLVSWWLHSYQWFWLRGTFPIRWQDAVFWGGVGGLVVLGALRELQPRRPRPAPGRLASWVTRAGTAAKILVTFATLVVLWSLWTSSSWLEWSLLMKSATVWGGASWVPVALLALALAAAGFLAWRKAAVGRWPFSGGSWVTAPALLLILTVAQPEARTLMSPGVAEVVRGLTEGGLNRQDQERLVQSYYEKIMTVERADSPLGEFLAEAEANEPVERTRFFESTGGFVDIRMLPNAKGSYKGKPFSTNRWGMRDRDYELEKPPGTYRIATIGASHVMGAGVADDEIFLNLVEDRLKREGLNGIRGKFEVLNFGLHNVSLVSQSFHVEERILQFAPDAVLYFGHSTDIGLIVRHLNRVLREGVPMPDPFLARVLAEQGVRADMRADEIERLLLPRGMELLKWGCRRLAMVCHQYGVTPVLVYMPLLKHRGLLIGEEESLAIAREAGMETLSLAGVYGGLSREARGALKVSRWNFHPNAVAHRLLAERLYSALENAGSWLFDPLSEGAATVPGSGR